LYRLVTGYVPETACCVVADVGTRINTSPTTATAKGRLSSYFKTDNILKNDVIIVCGGTWDISSNETNKGLRCFRQFAMKTSNTNVITLDAPHCNDLEEKLCINKEIIIFNRKFNKAMKFFQHDQLLIMNMSRNLFVKHGLRPPLVNLGHPALL
jgi:hypothetical protein